MTKLDLIEQHTGTSSAAQRARILLAIASLSLILTGCLFPSEGYRPVSTFDLEFGENIEALENPLPDTLYINRFHSVGPYDTRMVYRKSEHRTVRDEYNRWIQNPAELARRAFYDGAHRMQAFKSVSLASSADSGLVVTANILRWEVSPDLEAAIEMTVAVKRLKTGETVLHKRYSSQRRLNKATPEAFAAAASEAVRELVVQAVNDCRDAVQK